MESTKITIPLNFLMSKQSVLVYFLICHNMDLTGAVMVVDLLNFIA